MKKQIKREMLKTNFLKQLILRMDYDYLFEDNLEKIIEEVYPILTKNKYKMDSKSLFEYDMQVDAKAIENQGDVKIKNNKEEFPSFINKDKNITINITRKFTEFIINYKEYEVFETINEIFCEIVKVIKDIREGFSITRIGERKSNYFILKDITKLNNYFEPNTIGISEAITKDNLVSKDSMEAFTYKEYTVNQHINITNGILTNENKEEMVYQVILDIDIYNDEIQENKVNVQDMNNQSFEIYKSVLKEEFLENLKKEQYEDEVILKI